MQDENYFYNLVTVLNNQNIKRLSKYQEFS